MTEIRNKLNEMFMGTQKRETRNMIVSFSDTH